MCVTCQCYGFSIIVFVAVVFSPWCFEALSGAVHQGINGQLSINSTGVSLYGQVGRLAAGLKKLNLKDVKARQEQAAILPESIGWWPWGLTSVLEQSRGGSSWLLTNFWSKAFLVSFCFWQGIGWLGQETLLRVMNSAKNMRHGTWRLGLHEVQGALILNFILVLNYCIEKIPLAKSMFIRQHVCMLALAAPDPGNSTSLACRLECVAPKKKIQDKPGW